MDENVNLKYIYIYIIRNLNFPLKKLLSNPHHYSKCHVQWNKELLGVWNFTNHIYKYGQNLYI